ncbi:MAG: DUF6174 domain-containing protein [Gemmatimonadota bacterium]|nr:DUF6174 domain-containing protein [Gemmatimonadota bacterium]
MRCCSALPSFAISAAVLTLNVGACRSTPTGPEAGLAAARARWTKLAPAAYTITLYRSCECLAEMSGPVEVAVRSGAGVSRRYVQSGAAVAPQYADLFLTVEGLFAIIDAAVRDGMRPLDARYDATLGYPTRVAIGDPATDAPVYSVTALRVQ